MNKRNISLLACAFLILVLSACNAPKAFFSYKLEKEVAPARIKVENKSENAESYLWDFGDGTTSEEATPEHRYKSSGKFELVLIAKKGNKTNKMEKEIIIDAPSKCLIEVETPLGNMIVQLNDATPLHRDNFVKLVEEGFYNDLLFHRVINGFMIQGGDPNSKNADANARLGSGGPGYQVPAEFSDSLAHVKGALSAARQGDQVNPEKKSSGSQFYIVQGKPVDEQTLNMMESRNGMKYTAEQKEIYANQGGTPFLDSEYTVFGMVIEGLDVIDKIAEVQTLPGDRPQENIWMKMRVIK